MGGDHEPMVEVRGLRKRFADVEALAGIDFAIRRGEVLGLLGPNGAGKTTTIRIILGLTRPTAGTVRIAGHDPDRAPDAVRRLIGWVPQTPTLDPLLTGREQLRVLAALYELPDAERRVREALARFGLAGAADRLIRHYSGGMKKRLELAAGTLHGPELLVLDEPTAGLDVDTRHQIWHLIRELNAAGVTVLLTTHYLDEADALCHRVAILDRGTLRALDTPGALKRRYGRARLRLTFPDPAGRAQAAATCREVLGAAPAQSGLCVELAVDDLPAALEHLLPALRQRRLSPEEVEALPPSLDQVFARVTGRAFDPVTGQVVSSGPEAAAGEEPAAPGPAAAEGADVAGAEAPAAAAAGGRGQQAPRGTRPGVAAFLRYNQALLRRWWWRLRREPVDLFIAIAQPALWFLLFGHLWEGAARPQWAGGSYLRFMAGGAAMMTVFNVALMGGLDVLVDRERGTLDRFLVSPAPPLALVTSRFAFVTAVAACQTLAILAMARAMGIPFAAGPWAVPGMLLLAALFAAGVTTASLMLAFAVEHHGQFYTVTGVASLPVVLVSSVFAPVERMPAWLAALARVNPMTYAVDGARALVAGGAGPQLPGTVAALLLFDAAALLLARRLVRRALA